MTSRLLGVGTDSMAVAQQPLMFRNKLINGGFDIWQRGTSLSSVGTGIYLADRWKSSYIGTGVVFNYARSTDVPNVTAAYSGQVTQGTGTASALQDYCLRHTIELQNVLSLLGKQLTVSFWYKSSVTGQHGVRVIPLNMTGGTDTSTAFTVNAANTWEYKTITFNSLVSVTAITETDLSKAGLILDIGFRVGNTVGSTSVPTTSYFRVTQAQLEVGSQATAFEQRPIGVELTLCQRYYEKSYAMNVAPGTADVDGYLGWPVASGVLPTNGAIYIPFKVPKRADPAVSDIALWSVKGVANRLSRFSDAATLTGDSLVVSPGSSINSIICYWGVASPGTADYGLVMLHWAASTEL